MLLRGLTITPTRARYDDFELVLDDEEEVNPVLVHKLTSVFGAELTKLTPANAVDRLSAAAVAAEVPGFEITGRRVIGTFTYAKLPMVRDMEAAGDLLAESDLVAAIAGDPEAQELVSADRNPGSGAATDSPEDDYSVLDADSSQRNAIDTVLAGQSLVIHGPPGTGKSQTIANLIAALVARGRKVLFVAEKRAAIDAVLSRLKGVDLGDMVLDIHEGTRDRQRIASDLGATLDLAGQTATPDVGRLHRRLVDRVQRLSRHVGALHEVHEPWGLTPFAVQSALLGIPVTARTPFRLPAPERLDGEAAETVRDELREFAHLGGFSLRPSSTPWYGALLRTGSDAQQAIELAGALDSETLPMFAHRVAATPPWRSSTPRPSSSWPRCAPSCRHCRRRPRRLRIKSSRWSARWPPTRRRRGSCPGSTSWPSGSTGWACARCSTNWPASRRRATWPRRPSITPGTPRSWTRSGSAIPATRPSAAPRWTRSPTTSGSATWSTWPRTGPGSAAPGPR